MDEAADVYVVDLICGLVLSLNESLYVCTMHAVLAQAASAYFFLVRFLGLCCYKPCVLDCQPV